mmetsp:Transcript_28625/g.56009  ORF Transcript_28625/g.56009 Transcript_28625/m.56009 type:complete len:246 (+) Transcript_28625:67-804(+)
MNHLRRTAGNRLDQGLSCSALSGSAAQSQQQQQQHVQQQSQPVQSSTQLAGAQLPPQPLPSPPSQHRDWLVAGSGPIAQRASAPVAARSRSPQRKPSMTELEVPAALARLGASPVQSYRNLYQAVPVGSGTNGCSLGCSSGSGSVSGLKLWSPLRGRRNSHPAGTELAASGPQAPGRSSTRLTEATGALRVATAPWAAPNAAAPPSACASPTSSCRSCLWRPVATSRGPSATGHVGAQRRPEAVS